MRKLPPSSPTGWAATAWSVCLINQLEKIEWVCTLFGRQKKKKGALSFLSVFPFLFKFLGKLETNEFHDSLETCSKRIVFSETFAEWNKSVRRFPVSCFQLSSWENRCCYDELPPFSTDEAFAANVWPSFMWSLFLSPEYKFVILSSLLLSLIFLRAQMGKSTVYGRWVWGTLTLFSFVAWQQDCAWSFALSCSSQWSGRFGVFMFKFLPKSLLKGELFLSLSLSDLSRKP